MELIFWQSEKQKYRFSKYYQGRDDRLSDKAHIATLHVQYFITCSTTVMRPADLALNIFFPLLVRLNYILDNNQGTKWFNLA